MNVKQIDITAESMPFTGERYVPDVRGNIELEHLHRYLFACQLVAGKDVLDIASGEGYGSAILARTARRVIGVDIAQEAISHAQAKYHADNLEFRLGSCSAIPLADASVDVVVSFETIEHHDEHEAMLREIKRVLRPHGVLVISSPDKLEYSDRTGYSNPYHVKELYRAEFKELLSRYFKYQSIFGQRVVYGSVIFCEDRPSLQKSYERTDDELMPVYGVPGAVYLVAVASDSDLPLLECGLLEQPVADSEVIQPWLQAIAERDGQLAELHQAVSERDGQLAELHQAVSERDGQLAELNQQLLAITDQINAILASNSWRLTKPFRVIRRNLVDRSYRFVRRVISDSTRWIWRNLPLSVQKKQRLKSALFRRLPFVFGWTQAYHSWKKFDAGEVIEGGLLEQNALRGDVAVRNEFVPLFKGQPLADAPVKLICFYLPQFHAIPENDAWWGEGFTEWTNVRPAKPQFVGHYQPHIPGELGYYNLLDPAVMRRQVELAKLYGIGGFCFYFYWFGGKRLLETPIEKYLSNEELDFPFCLCWANENWTRRWDGLDDEILIAQEHSPEDDLAFIRYVARYMRDPRYIRIDGKPLLLVYRPSLLPSAKDTAQRWRTWCRNEGIGEIYLAYTQSFEIVDPAKYGFDAAIEFPPNMSSPPNITDRVVALKDDFSCSIYDWRVFVEHSKKYKRPKYKLFRGVCPSWDNTARRKNRGTVFLNSSPALYRQWLENAIRDTQNRFEKSDERLVFINAWNEWAEGAHLEPDQRYGYAWLQATRDALISSTNLTQRKIVLVSHDAHPHGAQYLALHLAQTLVSDFGVEVEIVLLESGILLNEFRRWGKVHDLTGVDPRGPEAETLARGFKAAGCKSAIVNTTVSGYFLETLANTGIRCVSLIHELRGIIETNALRGQVRAIAEKASTVVFPAAVVAESFSEIAAIPADRLKIRPQGLYKRNSYRSSIARARETLRKELQLPSDAQIVLGVGYADHRKGVDLFVEAGLEVLKVNPHAYFVWVGHWDATMRRHLEHRIAEARQERRFLFVGRKDTTDLYYAGADVYALTSREDPFPSVVLEALEVCIPVVGFQSAGGFCALLEKGCGVLVPKEDVYGFAKAVTELLSDKALAQEIGEAGAKLVRECYSFRHYVFDLLEWAGIPLKRVSVAVPNYNYAKYLKERIGSILAQTYPIYELVILDDASTDNSVEVIESCLENETIDSRLVRNKENSGSVFKQWRRAVDVARGDYVWICEADDYAEPNFLERVLAFFDDADVVMSYSQSKQVDEYGRKLADHYLYYTDDICSQKWRYDYVADGMEELSSALAIKNSIPNVSGVVFRKDALQAALDNCTDELGRLKIAGDWLIYSEVLRQGKIGYVSEPLNWHRRHQRSVTVSSSSNASHLAEIIYLQRKIANICVLDGGVQSKALEYVKKVYRQFRMNEKYASDPACNPEVSTVLRSLLKRDADVCETDDVDTRVADQRTVI